MLRYNALPLDYLRRQNQSFRDHQLMDNDMRNLVPYEPLHHKWQSLRVDGIYPLHPQQYEQIFYGAYLALLLIHAFHIKYDGERVLIHHEHQEAHEIQ